jgi:hypothetical protein
MPANQQTTGVPIIPLRTPMHDAQGNLTKPWIAFFQNQNSTAGPPGDPGTPGVGVGGVNVQTASYTGLLADEGKLVVFNSAAAIVFTLPSPPLSKTWSIYVEDAGAGALTVAPAVAASPVPLVLIDGAASLALAQGQGVYVSTDGLNYYTERGLAPAGVALQTNGTPNTLQSLLNLIADADGRRHGRRYGRGDGHADAPCDAGGGDHSADPDAHANGHGSRALYHEPVRRRDYGLKREWLRCRCIEHFGHGRLWIIRE